MNQLVDEAADALAVEALGRAVAAGVRGALWTPPCADFLRQDNLPDRSGDAWLVLAAAEDGQVGLEAREEETRNADRVAEGVHLRGGGQVRSGPRCNSSARMSGRTRPVERKSSLLVVQSYAIANRIARP